MTKSILIGAIAALMLFAFVACDNNAGSDEIYNPVVRMYQDNEVSYLANETTDFNDFVVMAQRLDGTTFQVSADQVVYDPIKVTSGTNAGTATYYTYTGTVVVNLVANVHPITSIEVEYTGTGSYDQYYQNYLEAGSEVNGEATTPNTAFHKDQYTVTAIYDGEQERVLEADEYVVSGMDLSTVGTAGYAIIAADIDKDGAADSEVVGYASNLVVIADSLMSISVEAADGVEFIAGATPETGNDLMAQFVVTGTYASGKTMTETPTEVTVDTEALNEGNYPAAGSSVTVTAKVGTLEDSVSVTTVADYIVDYTINNPVQGIPAGSLIGGANGAVTIATATWASGATTTEGLVLVSNPSNMDNNAVAGVQYPVTVSIQNHPEVDPQVIMVLCSGAAGGSSEE